MVSMYFGPGQRPGELRQSNPDTIRKFYANIERTNVGKQLRPAWKETPVIRNPLIKPLNPIEADINLAESANEPPVIRFQNEPSGCERWRTRRDSPQL
jgi:hypothetical protein